MDSIIQSISSFLQQYFSRELVVFIISMLPILELRGGILTAYALGLDLLPTYLICAAGNLIPVPFILLFGRKLVHWMKSTKLFRRLAHKLERKAKKQDSSPKLQRNKTWGYAIAICLFVAIPLPGTGAWTGACIAALLEMRFKWAFPAVCLGVLIAGFIVSALSYGLLHSIGIG